MEQRSFILRSIYALCLLGATWNHAVILFQHGVFWDYGGVSAGSAVFWTMLTVIDPAAVVLLYLRPKSGVAMTAAIIVVDVIHNLWIQALDFRSLFHAVAESPRLIAQILFMAFVLVTAPFALQVRPAKASASRNMMTGNRPGHQT